MTLLCCSVDIWCLLITHTCNVLYNELYITQTARHACLQTLPFQKISGHSLPSHMFMCEPNRPRSWSNRTHRSTWLFCRSTRSTSSTSRRFYDSTRLGWFLIDVIDLVDLRPCWSQISARACLLHGNWRKKNLCPSTWCIPSSKWKALLA